MCSAARCYSQRLQSIIVLVYVYEYYTPGLELRLELPKKRPCLLILQAKSLEFHRQPEEGFNAPELNAGIR